MKYLIFDSKIEGHHLEYIHHLYDKARSMMNDDFIFYLNNKFNEVKEIMEWEDAPNVKFEYLSDEEQMKSDNSNLLIAAWHQSWIVRRIANKEKIDKIWLIMFIHLMPFLPVILSKKIKIMGVLYRIYLYDKDKMKGVRLWLEKFRYSIFVNNKSVERILVLNDQYAVDQLNKIYSTDKFYFLPDPVPNIDMSKVKNIRCELGINPEDKVYLHFGGLDPRKGTLEILDAIALMSEEELAGIVFVFAGRVYKSMHDEFYERYEKLKDKVKILVYDEFCDYDFLNNLCYSCDCILIPYKNPNQSSGVIGYASLFQKPVIGPSQGLLGRLIKDYQLGQTIDKIDKEMILESLKKPLNTASIDYAHSRQISNFQNCYE